MTNDPQDLVKVYSGPMVYVQSYRTALSEEGITSSVVGTELAASFGSTLPGSIELWVHRSDFKKAETLISRAEEKHGKPAHEKLHQQFPHPTNDPKPGQPPMRKEPYVNPNPGS